MHQLSEQRRPGPNPMTPPSSSVETTPTRLPTRQRSTAKMLIRECLLLCLLAAVSVSSSAVKSPQKVITVTFLLTVNDTWYPDEYNTTCLTTVKTPPLRPDTPFNESQRILVGKCDSGPLTFSVTDEGNGHSSIFVTFYSSVIEDASHPACTIQWNYSYQQPTASAPNRSPLPGCFNAESREGYHMTYYWFHVLDWMLA